MKNEILAIPGRTGISSIGKPLIIDIIVTIGTIFTIDSLSYIDNYSYDNYVFDI